MLISTSFPEESRVGFGMDMVGERIRNARSTLRRVAEQLISIANEGEHCTFCVKVTLAFRQIAKNNRVVEFQEREKNNAPFERKLLTDFHSFMLSTS